MAATQPSMADLLTQHSRALVVPKQGDTVTGKITQVGKKSITVEIGAKTEGLISDREFSQATDYLANKAVGDEISAEVVSAENDRGSILLSVRGAAVKAKWEAFRQALDKEEVVTVKGVESNKGGVVVMFKGVRGFIPSSQFGQDLADKQHTLKDVSIKVKIIEADQEQERLIFSERHVSEAELIHQRESALTALEDGQVLEGEVTGVTQFGLFVTVEVKVPDSNDTVPLEGLVHISEISWEKVNHPRDYHQKGDKVQVKVLGTDEASGKLNLTIKQMSADPWSTIEEKYPVGSTFQGIVTRTEQFGVFINAEAGVDGLMHISKIPAGEKYESGQEVFVSVEHLDPAQRRMSLGPVVTEVPVDYK